MPLHPNLQVMLDRMNSAAESELSDNNIPRQRQQINKVLTDSYQAMSQPGPVLEEVKDITIAGPYGEIPVRIYRNDPLGDLPCYLHIHGGAWWLGNIEHTDALCRFIAKQANCLVINIEYRLAPEFKFPIPLEECYFVADWCEKNARSLGIDGSRIAIGGSSAGGNLAAAVCLLAKDRGGPEIIFQWLDIPATDAVNPYPSHDENAQGYFLTTAAMRQAWRFYLSESADAKIPYASPMCAEDVGGLPTALITTMEYDPLRDEGEAYAEKLKSAGVACELIRYPGVIHGSLMYTRLIPEAMQWQNEIIAIIAKGLNRRFG